jgi:ATP-GRASP peptide maturase of grasp-with-spasm system
MILILSQDSGEATSEDVMDWIAALGGTSLRLNGEDLDGEVPFSLSLTSARNDLSLQVDGKQIEAQEIRAVWLRRWHRLVSLAPGAGGVDADLSTGIYLHLRKEITAALGGIAAALNGAAWLTAPHQVNVNKLRTLAIATRVGLAIPDTMITNDRTLLQDFKDRCLRIVAKCIGDPQTLYAGSDTYLMYTSEVTQEVIDRLPRTFFPSLFQHLLDKAYELRVFYLDGHCYPMAIFSQLDQQTRLDFRRYNSAKPNRNVPYRLPERIETAIRSLMRELNLVTGSVDIVRTRAGEYVFLEVNPVGQFGMVSYPCNYRLEKRVAEYLLAHHEERHASSGLHP